MQDFLKYKDKIKSINYDNGIDKIVNELWKDYLANEEVPVVYEPIKDPDPIQTLTIDFGDCVFEIVGKVTWKTKESGAPQGYESK